MKSLVMSLLNDPFGVSRDHYKILMDIYEDETSPEEAAELDNQVLKTTIDGYERYRLNT